MLRQERGHDLLEARVLSARIDRQRQRLVRIGVEESEACVRASDVAGQDHGSDPTLGR